MEEDNEFDFQQVVWSSKNGQITKRLFQEACFSQTPLG